MAVKRPLREYDFLQIRDDNTNERYAIKASDLPEPHFICHSVASCNSLELLYEVNISCDYNCVTVRLVNYSAIKLNFKLIQNKKNW